MSRTMVFIHGAWATPLSWEPFIDFFQEQGLHLHRAGLAGQGPISGGDSRGSLTAAFAANWLKVQPIS